jgi:serine/threonine protein kinase
MDIPHLPDYELLAEIARSSLTCSFAARHRAGGFDCVVKLPRPEFASSPAAINAITREARIGLAIRHRHVVKTLDAQVHQSPHYLVTERMSGTTLSDRLRDGPLAWDHSLRVARQIAEALAAIHRFGFVHANLQPDKIALTSDGVAVLAEFASAHRPGEIVETTLDGAAAYHSFMSDWQSFAATVTEMLLGERPGDGDADNNILRYRSKSATARWVERQTVVWPQRLTELLARLTTISPQDQTTGALVIHELNSLEVMRSEKRLVA